MKWIVFFSFALGLQAQKISNEIEHHIFHYQFDSAKTVLNQHQKEMSEYRFALYHSFIYFYKYFSDQPAKRNIAYIDSMTAPLKSAVSLSDEEIKKLPKDDRLMVGGSFGFDGMGLFIKEHRLTALRRADKAKDILEDLIEDYPEMVDAYFGIGIYNYALSRPPKILRWFLSIFGYSGDYDKGISQLQKVAREGEETKVQSILYLINHSLYEDAHYEEMYGVFQNFPSHLVKSPMYTYKKIQFEYALGNYEEVIRLFHSMDPHTRSSYAYNKSHLEMARAKLKQGKYKESFEELIKISRAKDPFQGGMYYELRETYADYYVALKQYDDAYPIYKFIYENTRVDKRKERIELKLENLETLTNGRLSL